MRTRSRRLVFAGSLVSLLASHAPATWSIVVANTATGEVGVASATCLSNFNLEAGAGVVVVGRGAAQAQAAVDVTGLNRRTMFLAMRLGHPAPLVLQQILATDTGAVEHQYGIATLGAPGATFTGGQTFEWAGGVSGQVGPLSYAIQGNILTCQAVVDAAEAALLGTAGDLSQKMMAAMQAARSFGGDGRCSCSPAKPTSCGCPPPSFVKSADVGYVALARFGDTDGTCGAGVGCANGQYWLNLNVISNPPAADVVDTLQTMYDAFRTSKAGHPDGVRSEAFAAHTSIPADGAAATTLEILLADIEGAPLVAGGASVTVTHDETSAGICAIGAAVDHGNGTYTVPITAGTAAGTDRFRIVVNDGSGAVTLYPFPAVAVTTPGPVLREYDGEAEFHRLGAAVASAGDLDGDGRADALVGVPDASPGFPFAGQAKAFSGATGALLLTLDGSVEEGHAGASVARLGDANADGIPDVLVGAPGSGARGSPPGSARVHSGADGSLLFVATGADPTERFGETVAGLGDLNGDGLPDFGVGAPGAALVGAGRAVALSGADGSVLFEALGANAGDNLGRSIAGIGDQDGDGVRDVALGIPGADPGGVIDAGRVAVVSGANGSAIRTIDGADPGGLLGFAVASAGRVDADAIEDLVAGAPGAEAGGVAAGGRAFVFSGSTGAAIATFDGAVDGGGLGSSVAGTGDLNGDLRGEVAIGSPGEGSGGVVRVFSAANETLLFTHEGLPGDGAGAAVAGAGDANADGVGDLLAGAPGADPSGIADAGRARLLSLGGLGGAIPVDLRGRVALQRVLSEPDADASGVAEIRVRGTEQSVTIDARGLDGGGAAPYAAFVEDAAGSGIFLALGEMEAGPSGRWTLALSAAGTAPGALAGSLLSELDGRRIDVRADDGATVLHAALPSLDGEASFRKNATLAPPGRGYQGQPPSGKLTIRFDGRKGTARFELKTKALAPSDAYSVWIGLDGGSLVMASPLTAGRLRRDTRRGDPLPLGVLTVQELSGRAIQVREGSAVVLEGTIP